MLDEYSEAGGRGPHAAGPDRFLPVTPATALRLMLLALGLALTLAAVGLAAPSSKASVIGERFAALGSHERVVVAR